MDEKIDFVITWVDGNDPEWKKERNYYAALENREIDNSSARYRDWGTLRYWFRGIEKFAPWVNNIFFVTYGHLPEWLNVNHPKLKIIKHSDYIPKEYLPTYNSFVIEFYFHKIEGLSDKFVYFNDDMFLIDVVKQERFFKKGLPCDLGALVENDLGGQFGCSVYLAQGLINEHFNKRVAVKNCFSKWFNIAYPFYSLRNLLYMRIRKPSFNGFEDHHLPQGLIKKIYDEVWNNCEKDLVRTSKNRFRQYGDIAIWLMRYWQLASGRFAPYNVYKDGKYYSVGGNNIAEITECIRHQKYKLICLNDSDFINDFEERRDKLLNAFDEILPEKSKFEL